MQPPNRSRSPAIRSDPDSIEFWNNIAAGRLALQRCPTCSRYQFPPLERCRTCDVKLEWQVVSGRGTVHTFIVQHHNIMSHPNRDVPEVVALIAPDEAPELRIPARMGERGGPINIGERAEVEFSAAEFGDHPIAISFRLSRQPPE